MNDQPENPDPQPEAPAKVLGELFRSATGHPVPQVQRHLANQALRALWRPDGGTAGPADASFLAVMGLLCDIGPRDGLEGMLGVQMVAAHEAAMECMRRAMMPGQSFEGRDQNLKHAARLLAGFERMLAALDKHRGKGRQRVTVKHVHVNEGGQAIVGAVGAVPHEGAGAQAHRSAPQAAVEAPDEAPMQMAIPEGPGSRADEPVMLGPDDGMAGPRGDGLRNHP